MSHLRTDEDATSEIDRLGLRWVAVLDTPDPSYDDLDELPDSPLEVVVTGPTLTLYRVDTWRGPATGVDGAGVEVSSPASPLADIESDEAVTWYRPGSGGWLRGARRAHVSADGSLALPPGSGPVWYAPSLLVLLADGLVVGALILAIRRGRRS